MLKRIMANKVAKKSILFATAFVVIGVLMGGILLPGGIYPEAPDVEAPVAEPEVTPVALTAAQPLLSTLPFFPEGRMYATDPKRALTDYEFKTYEIPSLTSDEDFVYLSEIPMSYGLQAYTFERCKELDLNYELVLAIMWRESRFAVNAVNVNQNGTRDNGIMQINDVNRDWLSREHGISDLMDPVQNIDAGTAMLARFIDKYGEHGALMAYQYGETGMMQQIAQGVTTNDMIALVYEKRNEYTQMTQPIEK